MVKGDYRHIVGNFECAPGTFDSWTTISKLNVLQKWKTFVWRALNDILPTTLSLIIKRVDIDPACPKCGIEHEDIMHAFLLCDFARLVWHEAAVTFLSVAAASFFDWMQNVLHSQPKEFAEIVVAVLYYLWKARNQADWERSLPPPSTVWRLASSALTGWQQVHRHTQHQAVDASLQPSLHSRCYVDASYDHATGWRLLGLCFLH
ncbi:PREDICTED: uncharacterized protein LOC109162424 [Ipomoea nil]|uniref:uncharacterized protein LOC109162424 n=1 Tax=Ipomoea nil TaxID=35883 RepID=UPI000901F17C|nr:PREDICTED: uncharacterized protein LOC109162424 [Ipomoea nil]